MPTNIDIDNKSIELRSEAGHLYTLKVSDNFWSRGNIGLFSVSGASLSLFDVIIDGNKAKAIRHGRMQDYENLIMLSNGQLKIGNNAILQNSYNGAVRAFGDVMMTGGSIINNGIARGTSDSGNCGVNIEAGNFIMTDGIISKTNNGPGVTISQYGKFTMSGGTISDNDNWGKHGGGISIWGGKCEISGGMISGNNAATGGGIAVMFSGELTMTNCEIGGNTATYYGGGIAIGTNGTISDKIAPKASLASVTIIGNKAEYGGGISIGGDGLGTPELKYILQQAKKMHNWNLSI